MKEKYSDVFLLPVITENNVKDLCDYEDFIDFVCYQENCDIEDLLCDYDTYYRYFNRSNYEKLLSHKRGLLK